MPASPCDGNTSSDRQESPLGRPTAERAQQLAQNIVRVAAKLMLERGYDGTSLDAIAAAAGVTKRTIYSRFGSKEALLREVLASAALPALQPLPTLDPAMDLRDTLVMIGKGMNATLLHPEMQRWLRFAVTGLAHRPELIAFVHALIEDYVAFLQKVLTALLASKSMTTQDIAAAARFYGMLIAEPSRNLAVFAIDPGTEEIQTQYIAAAVDLFLNGCISSAASMPVNAQTQ